MWFGTLNNVFHRLLFSIYRQYNRIDNYYEQLFDIPLLVRCVIFCILNFISSGLEHLLTHLYLI